MQTLPSLDEIRQRAWRIGTTLTSLAREAGVHPSTALRGADGRSDPRMSKVKRVYDVLLKRERAAVNVARDVARDLPDEPAREGSLS
jgi:predicted transcriptional regulator